MPDRDSLPNQQRELEANLTRRALVEATQAFNRNKAYEPRTVFRADTLSTLRAELSEAQKALTIFDHRLAQAEEKLRRGLDGRDRLTGTRWQAAYDLALGRVLACRVRLESLKFELARMKASPVEFKNAQNNTWSIVCVEDLRVDRNNDVSLAMLLLKRVAARHPDTPFAFYAEAELKRGFGWKWEESHRIYKKPPERVVRPLLIQEVDPPNGGGFFGDRGGKRHAIKRERPGL